MGTDNWETECTKRADGQHCDCWYDGKKCCSCGGAMNFGQAIQALKDADDVKVARSGWNGKGMYLQLQRPDLNSKMTMPYIYLKTANTVNGFVPWNPNNIDMLADDWQVVD